MRFDLDRLPTDPVLLQKMLREMAQAMEAERGELRAAKQTVKAQGLTIEKLEHRLARLLRVQFGRSSEKMDNAQLRMMFEDVEAIPEPANDDAAALKPEPVRKAGTRAPIPAHIPRLTAEHRPEPCGCGGTETVICEDVTEVLDYVPARFRVLRHVRPRVACRSCETIRQVPAVDLPLPKVMASSALLAHLVVSRRVVGWAVSDRMKKDLAIRALEMAINLRQPPKDCIFHSDRGSQYCSYDFQKKLLAHGLRPSMSGKGNCYDNAAVETFFKSLKAEVLWRQTWPTRRQAETAIFQYINGFYNPRRRHSYLGGISPLAFEAKVA